ncbi:MAG: ATP-binding protein [Candidatus Angelobacter sp.]
MIVIPSRFEKVLQLDRRLFSAVQTAISTFEPILEWSKLPFFPEYTDHGEKHLSEVLRTADALIAERSRELITPIDICLLILAVLLHDLGMHLNEYGFLSLLSPTLTRATHDIDTKPWAELWREFISEARRFDGKTLLRIFGDTTEIRVPGNDPEQFTLRDRRLIGEFLRRHHARLAHEIALHDLPGAPGIGIPRTLPPELRDISGLIARSHGGPLRSFFEYIQSHYHLQEYRDAHIIYLMCILRIADYLQIQAERAPSQHLRVTRLRSPISLQEWRNHEAISNITTQDDDPEAILIQARPPDVQTFLRLTELLHGFQSELDIVWAVLGEVYGRREKLCGLGLELRRVKSNLDDPEKFSKYVSYVPCRASFVAADAELLKLLAQPLYGDNPTYGVRELIQNAVDACLELWDITTEPNPKGCSSKQADILIELTQARHGKTTLSVKDCGVGMTLDTLLRYFLRAGASYRRSQEWRRIHEDESGHSRVIRSGRFGIGVLAAFLLGDKISVSTRHISDPKGIAFSATLDTEMIELELIERPVGTTITIELTENITARLISEIGRVIYGALSKREYGFGTLPNEVYLLQSPSLSIVIEGRSYPLWDRWPSCGVAPLPSGWHRICAGGYKDIQWSFHGFGEIACNGIAVKHNANSMPDGWLHELHELNLRAPRLSVFDPDGLFPLTLTRTQLSSRQLPFEKELMIDICRDICAFVLTEPWEPQLHESGGPRNLAPMSYPGFSWKDRNRDYLCLQSGFTVYERGITSSLNVSRVLCPAFVPRGIDLPEFDMTETAIVQGPSNDVGIQMVESWGRAHLEIHRTGSQNWGLINGVRIHVHNDILHRWEDRISRHTLRHVSMERHVEEWTTITVGHCGDSSIELDAVVNWAQSYERIQKSPFKPAFAEYYLSKGRTARPSLLSMTMQGLLGTTVIPYNRAERRQKHSEAFSILSDYISSHLESHRKASGTRVVAKNIEN